MTKLKDVEGTEFPLLPVGVYDCVVAHVEKREGPKGPYFNWQYEIIKGPYSGRKLFDITSLSKPALWKLKKTLVAILGEGSHELEVLSNFEVDGDSFAMNIQTCIEKRCKLYVEHEESTKVKGKMVENVEDIYPAQSGEQSIDLDTGEKLPF